MDHSCGLFLGQVQWVHRQFVGLAQLVQVDGGFALFQRLGDLISVFLAFVAFGVGGTVGIEVSSAPQASERLAIKARKTENVKSLM